MHLEDFDVPALAEDFGRALGKVVEETGPGLGLQAAGEMHPQSARGGACAAPRRWLVHATLTKTPRAPRAPCSRAHRAGWQLHEAGQASGWTPRAAGRIRRAANFRAER